MHPRLARSQVRSVLPLFPKVGPPLFKKLDPPMILGIEGVYREGRKGGVYIEDFREGRKGGVIDKGGRGSI